MAAEVVVRNPAAGLFMEQKIRSRRFYKKTSINLF